MLFLCCNTLALVVNMIETFFEPDALLLNLLSDASNFLVIFNSSVNCVIYVRSPPPHFLNFTSSPFLQLIFNSDYREVFLFVLRPFLFFFRSLSSLFRVHFVRIKGHFRERFRCFQRFGREEEEGEGKRKEERRRKGKVRGGTETEGEEEDGGGGRSQKSESDRRKVVGVIRMSWQSNCSHPHQSPGHLLVSNPSYVLINDL